MTNDSKTAIHRIIQIHRERFQSLQEANFNKSEKELIEIVGTDFDKKQFPIPTFVLEILVWAFIILFPLILIIDPCGRMEFIVDAKRLSFFYIPMLATILIFGINQRKLVPKYFFKKKYVRYFVWNGIFLLIALFAREVTHFILDDETTSKTIGYFFKEYCFSSIRGHFGFMTILMFAIIEAMVCACCIVFNIFWRQILRAFIIREKGRALLQYELDFLKNQLSPHFLFNTLNNISALIQIDPKRAEESMAKLSKLLRVMLYQTSDATISIQEDIDILQKYADLEKLRLDPSYDLQFIIDVENSNFQIPPLLAMPLVENAIKHSINPNGKSFAHIHILQKDNCVSIFTENSNFPRKAKSNAGGLGLSTFKKRLDLIFPDHYKYSTSIEDGVYKSSLKLEVAS